MNIKNPMKFINEKYFLTILKTNIAIAFWKNVLYVI